jgi:peptide/nickel transport system permease protein
VLKYILKRLGAGLVMLFVISSLTYVLLIAGSGDIARKVLGVNATQEQTTALNAELGLDKPVVSQYGSWLSHAIRGDFGDSWFSSSTVTESLTSRLSVTLTIVGLAVLLAAVIAIIIGVAAAVFGGITDRLVQMLGLLGFAVPGFLLAFALVNVLSLRLGWFRATGYVTFSESPGEWFKSVTLPVLSLSFASLASVSLQVRGSVKDALGLDYVRTLRSRGLSYRRVVFKHVLRNAAGPSLSILGVQFIGLLGGAVIVEQIFAIPGLGQVAVRSTSAGDIPLVMGLVVVTAILVVAVNLVVDLLTAFLNPKVRLS